MFHLDRMLSGLEAGPSLVLSEIFRSLDSNAGARISKRVAEMSQKFHRRYCQSGDVSASKSCSSDINLPLPSSTDFSKQILEYAQRLFYKLLENILVCEKQKLGVEILALMCHQVFHKALFALCLEIVIYTFNSPRTFPWVLEALRIKPYDFYRVIEPVIASGSQLTQSMVNRLKLVEEQILESLAWRKGSPVWDAIAESGLPVPSCEDVSLPGQISSESPSGILGPTLARINLSSSLNNPAQQTQSTESEIDRPDLNYVQGERHEEWPTPYFGMTNEAVSSPQGSNADSSAPEKEAERSLTSPKVHQWSPDGTTAPTSVSNGAGKPRRTGSLSLFFRKFYHLASMRIQELCKQLAIDDLHVRRRIWTLFEHVVINHTEFLCERHADQIIMCSVYLMCQVTKNRRSLIDVWESYKRLRQFDLQMYTSVLLSTSRRQLNNGDMFPVDKENQLEGSSIEARGDLATFHAVVFEPRVISFARRVFGESALNENLKLSPLPTVRLQSSLRLQGIVGNGRLSSPCRRVSDHVYVRSLGQPVPTAPQIARSPNTAAQGLRFIVNCSPTEDLRAINRMIQGSTVDTLRSSSQRTRRVGKRLLVDDDPSVPITSGAPNCGAGCRGDEKGESSSPPKRSQMMDSPFIARKIQDMLRDRMELH